MNDIKPCMYSLQWSHMDKPNRLTVFDHSGQAYEYMSKCDNQNQIKIVPLVEYDAVNVELTRLREENARLKAGVDAVMELIDNSHGVAGLHLNGDIAEWDSLLEGGNFESWLIDLSIALEQEPSDDS